MKFLSSFSTSSSSSSSTSSPSFDESMYNSKRATAGCIVGVVRRLLCSASFPTYPSDHILEEINKGEIAKDQDLIAKENINPGIVARLMGLDSMPKKDLADSRPTQNSISRSRSMNFVNYSKEFEQTQGKHRRVKTSLSFRELPTFLELENEEFFIINFENGGKSEKLKSKGKKYDMGRMTEKDEDQNTKKKVSRGKQSLRTKVADKPRQMDGENCQVSYSDNILLPSKDAYANLHSASENEEQSRHINSKQACDAAKLSKKKKIQRPNKRVMLQSSPEESSPVSVLDFNQVLADLEACPPEGNSRRKLSSEQENCKQPSFCVTSITASVNRETDTTDARWHGIRMQNYEIWCGTRTLPELEVEVSSNWEYRDKLDFEDIGAELEVHILDELLNGMVDQLAPLPYECLNCKAN